jgi:RNA polymerase sigma factor (sigma-70 family)
MDNASQTETQPGQGDWFTTTHWSIVLAAGETSAPGARQALEHLCQTYWYPLYAYVRRQGSPPHDAQDLIQGFFARMIEKNYLQDADQTKGRFRAFLLASLKHFLSDQRRHDRALKRGGGKPLFSLDEQTAEDRYRLEPVEEADPEQIYERRWALTVLEQARLRLREEWNVPGKAELYDRLDAFETHGGQELTYAEIGAQLGVAEGTVKSSASRLRQRYLELLKEEIAQTVAGPQEVGEEVRYLLAVIGS